MMPSWNAILNSGQKKNNKRVSYIQQNYLLHVQNDPYQKFVSPTLSKLQSQDKQTVKRISNEFEEQIKRESSENLLSKLETPIPTRKRNSARNIYLSKIEEKKEPDQTKELIEKILRDENDYVLLMEYLIANYVEEFKDEHRNSYPDDLDQLTLSIFGPIESIYKLHVFTLKPKILASKHNIVDFCNAWMIACDEGYFNNYLLHAMCERDMMHKRINFHADFMQQIEEKIGIGYSLFSPVQQLSKYHLSIIDMIRELMKQNASSETIKVVSNTEMKLNNVISKIYAARNLN